jgi:hypothetical protein
LMRPFFRYNPAPHTASANTSQSGQIIMNPIGFLFIAGGLFSAGAAVADWEWFMNHPKARLWCSIFGRGGARFFYVVLGIALIVLGAMFVGGVIKS